MKKVTAIILAAGNGRRMETTVRKQFLEINDKPVVVYALEAFQKSKVDEIVLVCQPEDIEYCTRQIVEGYNITKVTKVVAGGEERYNSVYNGLVECDNSEYVLIHDGARPFIQPQQIDECIEQVREYGAVVMAVPAKDTIKVADLNGMIVNTPRRDTVWLAQTPQAFEYRIILNAYNNFVLDSQANITDDAMLVAMYADRNAKIIMGSYENIKLTTPDDINLAKHILKK